MSRWTSSEARISRCFFVSPFRSTDSDVRRRWNPGWLWSLPVLSKHDGMDCVDAEAERQQLLPGFSSSEIIDFQRQPLG